MLVLSIVVNGRFFIFLQHVLDSSSPNLDDQRETVLQVLGQIGVSEEKLQNMIEVWNKVLQFSKSPSSFSLI